MNKSVNHIVVLFFSAVLCACASQKSIEQANTSNIDTHSKNSQVQMNQQDNNDPFEPVNRVIWDFNYEVLDKYLLKPLTKGYVSVVPMVVRKGLVNASNNLEEPANTVNNLLQGKPSDSAGSLGRFAINSTVGLLGIFDVASTMGLERKNEDFGQVLGVWGVETGPYLMLPGLGPSDVRSLTGTIVDNYYWPTTVLDDPYVIAAGMVGVLEARAALMEQEENLTRSLDQYLFVRDAYFQRLEFEVKDGNIEQKSDQELEAEEDDFADFEAMLENL